MKALVYHGEGRKAWEEKRRPAITTPTDAIVRITTTTICGTDLHILKGDVPTVTEGRVLGHEGVGIVEEVGPAVVRLRPGDRVLVSCISADGTCDSCRRGMSSHCANGGWVLGNTIDGTQAEYVRIPFADTSLYPAPLHIPDDALVMLSDILPTGFECGVLNGHVSPGDVVAIVGAGPIGLAALLTARFYSPSDIIMIDVDDHRLETAKQLGATCAINSGREDAGVRVMELTGGRGVDVAVEAVGVPATFDICQAVVVAGGHIASIGVFGTSVELHLDRLWSQNITLTTRLVDAVTTPMLLKMLAAGTLDPRPLATHRFRLDDIVRAYDTFANAAREKALKVILASS
jgi:alcohol dehydrogenase